MASEDSVALPFRPGTQVLELLSSREMAMKRVTVEHQTVRGPWLMEPKDVEDASPEEIRDRYGMDRPPVWVVDAIIPKGQRMFAGLAAAQPQWAARGKGIQFFVFDSTSLVWGQPVPFGLSAPSGAVDGGSECRLDGSRISIGEHLVDLKDRVVELALFPNQLCGLDRSILDSLGLSGQGDPSLSVIAVGESGTAYDISSQGVVVRAQPRYSQAVMHIGSLAEALRGKAVLVCGLGWDVPITVRGETLRLGSSIAELTGPFRSFVLLKDLLVATVEPRSGDSTDNIFGIDKHGAILWRIDTDGTQMRGGFGPLNGASICYGTLTVTNANGITFTLDPLSGRIVGGCLGARRF